MGSKVYYVIVPSYNKMRAANKWSFCNSSPNWCLTTCVPTPFWLGLRPHNPFLFTIGLQIWLTKRAGVLLVNAGLMKRVVMETKRKTIIKLLGCI